MLRLLTLVAVAGVMMMSSVNAAEARLFEPQENWWTSGHTCIASRGPAGRRWRALPPRSCSPERSAAEAVRPTVMAGNTVPSAREAYALKLKWAMLSAET